MVKTVTLNTEIPANRELRITLPADIPTGWAAVVVTVSSPSPSAAPTFGDLLESEFFGMWRDRADIERQHGVRAETAARELEAAHLMNLVDTDVLVDCLRGIESAKAWLNRLALDSFAVPAPAAMELVMGCRGRADLTRVQKFLGMFEIAWPEASEFASAYDLLFAHRLSLRPQHPRLPDCGHGPQSSRLPLHIQSQTFSSGCWAGCPGALSTGLTLAGWVHPFAALRTDLS
jgi:predicted nucleic acid-binding protein